MARPPKQCAWFGCCPLKRFYEEGRLDKKWIEKYCFGDFSKCARYQMEQKGAYHPDAMMPDGAIDKRLL